MRYTYQNQVGRTHAFTTASDDLKREYTVTHDLNQTSTEAFETHEEMMNRARQIHVLLKQSGFKSLNRERN